MHDGLWKANVYEIDRGRNGAESTVGLVHINETRRANKIKFETFQSHMTHEVWLGFTMENKARAYLPWT